MSEFDFLEQLYTTVKKRAKASPEESYTAKLVAKGREKICQKLGEEAVELALAGVQNKKKESISESADLLYHISVLWVDMGISPNDIAQELARRETQSGLDEKKEKEAPMTLDKRTLDVLFNEARSHNGWLKKDVPDALLKQLYDLTKMAPTSANTQPLRVVFVKSDAAKAKLLPAVALGNVEKVKTASVCAILGMDMAFYDHLPKLFPHADARSWFAGNEKLIADTAFRNSSLQGGYFILAARALGLDTGALSGFDNAKVDEAFFAGTQIKSNFLCNLGYGDAAAIFPRSPRPDFDDFCKIA